MILAMRRVLRLKNSINRFWWQLVKRVSRRRYFKHLSDADPDGDDPTVHQDYLFFETRHWQRRAEKVHVSVSDIPLEDGKSHWETGYDRLSYIRWSPLRKLKKLVIDAEYEKTRRKREGRELWVKYVTVVAAVLGAIASLVNLLITAGKK